MCPICVDSWLAGLGLGPIDGGNARVSARSACVRGTACAHWPHPMHLAFDHRTSIGARLACACPLSSRSQAVVARRPPLIRSRPQIRRRHAAQLILALPRGAVVAACHPPSHAASRTDCQTLCPRPASHLRFSRHQSHHVCPSSHQEPGRESGLRPLVRRWGGYHLDC